MENWSCIFGNGSCHGNSMAAGQAYDLIDPLYVPYCRNFILVYGCYITLLCLCTIGWPRFNNPHFFLINILLNIYHCILRTWTSYFPVNFISADQLSGCCWLQIHGFFIVTWPFSGLHPASESPRKQFCTSKLYLLQVLYLKGTFKFSFLCSLILSTHYG